MTVRFEGKEIALLLTGLQRSRCFWIEQRTIAESSGDDELRTIAASYIRDLDALFEKMTSRR